MYSHMSFLLWTGSTNTHSMDCDQAKHDDFNEAESIPSAMKTILQYFMKHDQIRSEGIMKK